MKDAIVAKINSNKNAWNLQATINNGNIEITRTDASLATIYFNEVKGVSDTAETNQKGQSLTDTSTKVSTRETGEEFKFSLSSKDLPLTLTINGSKYNFYNSSDYPGMSLITPSGRSTSENTLLSSIASRIVSAYGGDTLVSCKVEGNAITVTSLVADKVMDFKQGIVVGPETELGFGKNGLTLGKDFVQKSQVELTLPPSDQYSTLDGSGFFLGSIPFEFTTDEKTGAETRKIDIRSCAIYAGDSEGKPEWIGVRLPNLSLKKLNLDPPRPDLTDVDSIEDVRKRLRIADDVIGLARGALGADQNRLDHAKENLSVAAEQTADTYSRIRDLDMAEGVTEQVKLSILQQSQKSALAHINQQASEVLKLMQ